MQVKTSIMMCATVAAGLCLTGCRTVHSDRNANRATPVPGTEISDNEVVPTPPVLDVEPASVRIREPAPAKETPWYITHGEVAATDSKVSNGGAAKGAYIVQKGDIAGRIAKQNGVSLAALKAANPGVDLNKIKIGQKLVIPAKAGATGASKGGAKAASTAVAAPGTYIVQKGDILGRIAKQHGVKVADLKAANGLTSDKIQVGQKLVIPGKGAKTVTVKATDQKVDTVTKGTEKKVDLKPALPGKTDEGEVMPLPPPPPTPPVVTTTPDVKPADNSNVFDVPSAPVPPAPAKEDKSVELVIPPPPAPAATVAVPPAPAPTTKPAASSGKTHTVMQGEDLFSIAIRWGVSPQEIKDLNGIDDKGIVPGTVLKIPGAE